MVAGEVAYATADVGGIAPGEWNDLPADLVDRFDDHAPVRDGSALVVSRAVAAAGVTGLAPGEVVGIYTGEIENWRAVGGPDREIHVVGGAEGSQPTPLQAFLHRRDAYGTGLAVRYGRPQRRVAVVDSRDDAVAPVPVGVAERALLVDGDASVTTRGDTPASAVGVLAFSLDGERVDLYDPAFPLTSDPGHYVTLAPTDDREQAFLDALRSPFGRRLLVGERSRLANRDPPG
jgi:phosphate transport system substrate-binding protein